MRLHFPSASRPGLSRPSTSTGERSLGRDIALALLLKAALLTTLYLAFFSGDRRPAIDDAAAARHLLVPTETPR